MSETQQNLPDSIQPVSNPTSAHETDSTRPVSNPSSQSETDSIEPVNNLTSQNGANSTQPAGNPTNQIGTGSILPANNSTNQNGTDSLQPASNSTSQNDTDSGQPDSNSTSQDWTDSSQPVSNTISAVCELETKKATAAWTGLELAYGIVHNMGKAFDNINNNPHRKIDPLTITTLKKALIAVRLEKADIAGLKEQFDLLQSTLQRYLKKFADLNDTWNSLFAIPPTRTLFKLLV